MRSRFIFIIIPIVVFVAVESVNFLKPFGFFRESNAAMVCINIQQWQKFPALKQQGIPITSFAFDSAAAPAKQLYNTVLTFGNGWFVLPYYFLKSLHLPANEMSIRFFSLCWFVITLFSVYVLVRELAKDFQRRSTVIYLSLLFYVFNAAVLWYHVQGYVHETAVLPFYFMGWGLFIKYLKQQSLSLLLSLSIMLLVALQFDWLPFFQAFIMSCWMLFDRKNIRHKADFLVPLLSVLLGVAFIFYQYTQWATVPVYLDHLKEKFLKRSIGGGGLQLFPWLNYNFNLILFYGTGYGLLGLIFLQTFIKKKIRQPYLWLIITSAGLHHFIFWGFSTEHDHAVVKMALPIAFASAVGLSGLAARKRVAFTSLAVAFNISLYFFLHNYYQRSGIYTNPAFCAQTGNFIYKNFQPADKIFINTEGKYFLQLEYYAHKQYHLVNGISEASTIMKTEFPGKNGYYIDLKDGEITHVVKIND